MATAYYGHAIDAYRCAPHPIFDDDHPVKRSHYRKLDEMVDRRAAAAYA